jgi:Stage II sporulation protein E (SpoIIE)
LCFFSWVWQAVMSAHDDLDSRPLHELPARVVDRARELAGDGLIALYLTDVDGACLLRLAGDEALPPRLGAAGAVGPELDPAAVDAIRERVRERWPQATVAPLWVLGRALGVLITTEPPAGPLAVLAEAAAPLFELAAGFSDVFERGRRRKQPSAAAEVQLELLPPRIARVAAGSIAASVLPAYDVGGDWFDHADNEEGVWLAIGDAMGKGIRAAAISAVSIGALRSARRAGADVRDCAREMHRAIHELGSQGFVTAVIGFWDLRQSTFTWTNCGHLPPLLTRDGTTRELLTNPTYPLGIIEQKRQFPAATINVRSGDRLLIYSDGIVEARLPDATRFGLERFQATVRATAGLAPPAAVARIERDVLDATGGEIRDDATQLLLALD